jgi:hypothetical protein
MNDAARTGNCILATFYGTYMPVVINVLYAVCLYHTSRVSFNSQLSARKHVLGHKCARLSNIQYLRVRERKNLGPTPWSRILRL